MGIFDKFKIGFKKSASALTSGLKEIIIKKEIDDKNLNKIEEFLIESDVGVEAASEIKEIISSKKIDPNKDLSTEINLILKEYIISLMKPLENNSFFQKKENKFFGKQIITKSDSTFYIEDCIFTSCDPKKFYIGSKQAKLIYGDKIILKYQNDILKELEIPKNAYAITPVLGLRNSLIDSLQQKDSLKFEDQMKGKKLYSFFKISLISNLLSLSILDLIILSSLSILIFSVL